MTTFLIHLSWCIMLMCGIILKDTSKYRKTGIMLIILFFAPIVTVIVSLYLWLHSCPEVSVCLADNFWDAPYGRYLD